MREIVSGAVVVDYDGREGHVRAWVTGYVVSVVWSGGVVSDHAASVVWEWLA